MLFIPSHAVLLFFIVNMTHIYRTLRVNGNPLLIDPNSICRRTRTLAGKHADLCQSQPETVQEVTKGARLGIRECQHQFRHHLWNCSSHSRSLAKVLQQDIRESAFVNAITAAGVLHAVTHACSQGSLPQCGCATLRGPSERWKEELPMQSSAGTEGRWEWGGCGDDVDFGYDKSRQFTDTRHRRRRSDVRTLIDLHNNEAGRQAVQKQMRTECKCHGLSGSCTIRSCWRKMPLFRQVGDQLMQSFHVAVRVMGGNDGKSFVPISSKSLLLNSDILIYSAESPDFCRANLRSGTEGTRGRECNSAESGPGGCDRLCCGNGFAFYSMDYEENCVCKFQWCCVVQCQRCSLRRNVSLCL